MKQIDYKRLREEATNVVKARHNAEIGKVVSYAQSVQEKVGCDSAQAVRALKKAWRSAHGVTRPMSGTAPTWGMVSSPDELKFMADLAKKHKTTRSNLVRMAIQLLDLIDKQGKLDIVNLNNLVISGGKQ